MQCNPVIYYNSVVDTTEYKIGRHKSQVYCLLESKAKSNEVNQSKQSFLTLRKLFDHTMSCATDTLLRWLWCTLYKCAFGIPLNSVQFLFNCNRNKEIKWALFRAAWCIYVFALFAYFCSLCLLLFSCFHHYFRTFFLFFLHSSEIWCVLSHTIFHIYLCQISETHMQFQLHIASHMVLWQIFWFIQYLATCAILLFCLSFILTSDIKTTETYKIYRSNIEYMKNFVKRMLHDKQSTRNNASNFINNTLKAQYRDWHIKSDKISL